jgi:tetratricopeptide (TPR) repeat protein
MVQALTGQLSLAEQRLDQALLISRQAGEVFHQSLALYLVGHLKNWEGEYAKALDSLSEGLRIARKHSLLVQILHSVWVRGLALTAKGDYDDALAALEEGLALSEKVGDEIMGHRMLNSLGWLHSECGNLERAIDLNKEATARARKRGDPETIANPELNLGDAFLAQGDLALAQEFLDGVYRLAHDPATTEWMRWRYTTHLFVSLGELWLVRGDLTKAREFVNHSLDIATRTNSRKYLVKGWRLKGEIGLVGRQWDEAKGALDQALTMAERIGNPTQLWKTHLVMGQLHTEAKRPEMAQRAYRAAREVVDGMKASTKNPELRASLGSSPMFQAVYDLTASD